MAAYSKMFAQNLAHTLQSPERSRKARSFRAGDEDLDQLLFMARFQFRLATRAACGSQRLLATVQTLPLPAHDRLAADFGSPSDLRLGKPILQKSQGAKAPPFHRFEVTFVCHARKHSRQTTACHYIMQ